MNITVYLGANAGSEASLAPAVRELGTWIGTTGNTLVYGGSRSGLMGELARAALAAGAEVIGVEPRLFIEQEMQLEGLTQLIVCETMPERRAKMIELGDAFIAFPGGTGTLEEISEVMSRTALGLLDAPCIFYNLNGYYDALRVQVERMVAAGLSTHERLSHVAFAADLNEIAQLLEAPHA